MRCLNNNRADSPLANPEKVAAARILIWLNDASTDRYPLPVKFSNPLGVSSCIIESADSRLESIRTEFLPQVGSQKCYALLRLGQCRMARLDDHVVVVVLHWIDSGWIQSETKGIKQ